MVNYIIIENWENRSRELDGLVTKISGKRPRIIRPYLDERVDLIGEDNALILTGSPLSVNDTEKNPFILWEMDITKYALNQGIPTLGICFGHQLLAKLAGCEVKISKEAEVGWKKVSFYPTAKEDPILRNLASEIEVFQLHFEEVYNPGQGLRVLAYSESSPVQAFRHRNAWGIQFHPEINPNRGLEIFDMAALKRILAERNYDTTRINRMPISGSSQYQRKLILKNFMEYCENENR